MKCDELTYSVIAYLEAIYRLHKKAGYVRPVDIASDLNVKKPSVTRAIKVLTEEGLIFKDGREIKLTAEGTVRAETLCCRCQAIRAFFKETVGEIKGLSTQEVCLLSYSMSDTIIDAIQTFLHKNSCTNCSCYEPYT